MLRNCLVGIENGKIKYLFFALRSRNSLEFHRNKCKISVNYSRTEKLLNQTSKLMLKSQIRQTHPVSPSTVSSMGKMCILFPYLTSGQDWIETISDRRTRKLFLTTRFMRIFSSGQASSESTMQTVSLRRFPFSNTVSPLNNCSSSILAWDNETIELSSLVASSTNKRFGRSLRFKIAIDRSSGLQKMRKSFN